MTTLFSPIREFLRKGDMLLLSLCLLSSGYGLILIYSATRYQHEYKSVIVQTVGIILGIIAYILLTFVDFHLFIGKNWKPVLIASVLLILLLLTPLVFRPLLFPLFKLTPGAVYAATCMVCILGVYMPLRSFDVTNITGILRAGGDVRAATVIDLSPLWCLAIPLAALAALVLELDVFWVCMAIYAENLAKAPVGLWRFHSRKWINDVTGADRPSEQH